MSCNCIEDIVYTKDPPYVSTKSVKKFFDNICTECNETILVTSEPTYPECCDDQIVLRGNVFGRKHEVLRVYDAGNEKYIGVGATSKNFNYEKNTSTPLTANVSYYIPLTSQGSLTVLDQTMDDVNASGDNFVISGPTGFYSIEATLDLNNTTTIKGVNFEIITGAESRTDTLVTTGANPSENSERRIYKVGHKTFLNTGHTVRFRIVSGITFTSSNINMSIRFTRLAVTK